MSLLSQYLTKLGVRTIDELTAEEKETYSRWESALNGRQISDQEVRQFLDVELENAIAELLKQRLGDREDTFLKMKVDFIRKITDFLDAPKKEQEAVANLIKSQM